MPPELRDLGGVQLIDQAVERLSTAESAPTPSPFPPPQGQELGTSDCPEPPKISLTRAAAETLHPTVREPSSEDKVTAESHVKRDAEGLSAGPNPMSRREKISRGIAGRRAGRKVWACAGCGIAPDMTERGRLQECMGCRSVRYCGRKCQKADWPAHKGTCKRLQAA